MVAARTAAQEVSLNIEKKWPDRVGEQQMGRWNPKKSHCVAGKISGAVIVT
jgi:hypothetical protein